MADLSAPDLYQRLSGPALPRVLDVRNAEEFARWRVEGPHPVDTLNVPYFEFVEKEEASVRKVTDWLGGRGDLVVVCAEGGSSAYVPPDPANDKQLIAAFAYLRGVGQGSAAVRKAARIAQ